MKAHHLIPLWTAGFCFASEPIKFPLDLGTLKTVDGRVYDGVKVVGEDAVGIKITHEGGTARISHERLRADIASRFNRDPAAAKAQLEKEAKERAANDRAMAAASIPQPKPKDNASAMAESEAVMDDGLDGNEVTEEPDTTVEELPQLDGKAATERILALQSYIRRLNAGIAKTKDDIKARMARAQKVESTAHYTVQTRNEYTDRISTRSYTNQSKVHKAEFIRKMAARQAEKITQANQLIEMAEAEIESLQPPEQTE